MKFIKLLAAPIAMAAACLSIPTMALAQVYPSKTITIFVPFPGGGSTDFLARTIGSRIGENLKQSVIVDNRPGGGAQIAANAFLKEPADGHTLFIGDIGALALNPSLFTTLSYDPLKDFQPVSRLVIAPSMLVVPKDSPYKSLGELVAAGKTNPNGVTCASQGPGSGGHLFCELFRKFTGLKVTHVPYKGSVPALSDIMASRVDLIFDAIITSGALVKDGKIKGLAIGTAKRSPQFPDVPTLDEIGYGPSNEVGWFGIVAKVGTPRPIVARLNSEINSATNSQDVSKRFNEQGFEVATGTPEEFGTFMQSENARWSRVIKDAGIKLD